MLQHMNAPEKHAHVVARQDSQTYDVGLHSISEVGTVDVALAYEADAFGVVLDAPQLGRVSLVLKNDQNGALHIETATRKTGDTQAITLQFINARDEAQALSQLKQHAQQIELQLQVAQRQYDELLAEHQSAQSERDELKTIAQNFDAERKQWNEKRRYLETQARDVDSLQARIASEQQERAALNALLEEKSAAESQIEQRLQAKSQEFDELKTEKETLLGTLDEFRLTLESQQQKLTEQQALTEELAQAQEQVGQLRQRIEHHEHDAIQRELGHKASLALMQSEITQQNAAAPVELEEARNMARTLFSQVETLTAERDEARDIARKLHLQTHAAEPFVDTAASASEPDEELDSPMRVTISPVKGTLPGH
jgi:chromosome segregation ATPase